MKYWWSPSQKHYTTTLYLVSSYLIFLFLDPWTLSSILLLFTNLFQLVSFPALLVELDLSFLTGTLCVIFTITKVALIESIEVFRKDPILDLYFSLFSSLIFLLSVFFHPALSFMLTTWPSGPPLARSLLQRILHKEL